MALNFPSNPIVEQTYTSGGVVWQWNGTSWVIQPATTINVTDITTENVTSTNTGIFNDLTATGTVAFNTVSSGSLSVTNNASFNNVSITGTLTANIDVPLNLNDLDDVNAPSPLNLQQLRYETSSQTWVPFTPQVGAEFNGGTISNPLFINNTTATTGTTSGALRVGGGLSVADDIYVGGLIISEDEGIEIRGRGEVKFFNSGYTNYVSLRAPTSISVNKIYTLPGTDGSSGQFLSTDGSGNLSWASAAGAGGGTPPGGLNTQIQFNNNGSFGGDAGLTYNVVDQIISLPNAFVSGTVTINDTTESTSSTSGSVVIAGGVGIEKQINVDGATNKFNGNTESTSINTGTIVVTGGMGVSGRMNVGSTVSADTDPTAAEHLTNKRYVDANILAFSVAFGA